MSKILLRLFCFLGRHHWFVRASFGVAVAETQCGRCGKTKLHFSPQELFKNKKHVTWMESTIVWKAECESWYKSRD